MINQRELETRIKALHKAASANEPAASIIALINDGLVAAGKSPLGFLNPFLYANPQAFTDITSGQSSTSFCFPTPH